MSKITPPFFHSKGCPLYTKSGPWPLGYLDIKISLFPLRRLKSSDGGKGRKVLEFQVFDSILSFQLGRDVNSQEFEESLSLTSQKNSRHKH